jgi:hypothetical protein
MRAIGLLHAFLSGGRQEGSAVPTKSPGSAATATRPEAPAQDEPLPGAKPPEQEGNAFDLWLRRNLRQAFDAVVAEPIPNELLRLIEEDQDERDRITQRRV